MAWDLIDIAKVVVLAIGGILIYIYQREEKQEMKGMPNPTQASTSPEKKIQDSRPSPKAPST